MCAAHPKTLIPCVCTAHPKTLIHCVCAAHLPERGPLVRALGAGLGLLRPARRVRRHLALRERSRRARALHLGRNHMKPVQRMAPGEERQEVGTVAQARAGWIATERQALT